MLASRARPSEADQRKESRAPREEGGEAGGAKAEERTGEGRGKPTRHASDARRQQAQRCDRRCRMWYGTRWWSENFPLNENERTTEALQRVPPFLSTKFPGKGDSPTRSSPQGRTPLRNSPQRNSPGADASQAQLPGGTRQRQRSLPPLLPGHEPGSSPQRPQSRGSAPLGDGGAPRPWTTGSNVVGATSRQSTLLPAGVRPATREKPNARADEASRATVGRVRLRSAALLLLKKGAVKVAEPPESLPAAASRYSDEVLAGPGDYFSAPPQPPPPGLNWHVFLCHSPSTGVDHAIVLKQALAARCPSLRVCLRYTAGEELTAREVREIVPSCAALVVVLTSGALARPDVQVLFRPASLRCPGRHCSHLFIRNSLTLDGNCAFTHPSSQLAVKLALAQGRRICLLHDANLDTGGMDIQEIEREGALSLDWHFPAR